MKNITKTLSVLVDAGTIALCAWSIYKTLRPSPTAPTIVLTHAPEPMTDVNAAPAV